MNGFITLLGNIMTGIKWRVLENSAIFFQSKIFPVIIKPAESTFRVSYRVLVKILLALLSNIKTNI